MKSRFKFLAVLALSGALGWALAGCSKSPLSPSGLSSASGGGSGVSILTVSPDGVAGFMAAPTGSALSSRFNPNLSGSTGTASIAASAVVDGSRGGTLTCGRYTLSVPPGAFSGTATITLSLADSTVMLADLAISPAEMNSFQVPVQLSLDTHNLSVDPSTLSIFWYDPAQSAWVNLFAGSDSTAGTLTAYLSHFSTYAAGKAGW